MQVAMPNCETQEAEWEISFENATIGCENNLITASFSIQNDSLLDLPSGTQFNLSWIGIPGGASYDALTGCTMEPDGSFVTLDYAIAPILSVPGSVFRFYVQFVNLGCQPVTITLHITSPDINIVPNPLSITLTFP